MRTCLSVVVALATVFTSTRASARPEPRAGAALVHAEGEVSLNDRLVEANYATSVLPDVAVLRTSLGRGAIALKRGGWLFLGAGTSVRVLGNGVYNFNRIEVLTGSAIVASETSAPLVDCENDIRLSDFGMFRFDVQRVNATGERSCRFRVFEGAAAVPLVSVISALRAGQTMMCNRRCGDMIPTMEFSREQLDVGLYNLSVAFKDGTEQRIDFAPVLHGPLFGALQDLAVFNAVGLDDAGTLIWPNGADFDPATLHDWAAVRDELAARARTWASSDHPRVPSRTEEPTRR